MKTIIALFAILILTGCMTAPEKQAAADTYYNAQQSFVTAQAANRKPIFELKGIPGESIRISGVSALTVWGGEDRQVALKEAPLQKSEFIEALGMVKDTALGLAPFALGAKVITGMSRMGDSINAAGAAGHGPVTTTSTTTTSNANQANPTTTTQTAGNNSVIGSGTASNPTTTTNTTTNTTTTDSHPVTTSTNTCTTGTC